MKEPPKSPFWRFVEFLYKPAMLVAACVYLYKWFSWLNGSIADIKTSPGSAHETWLWNALGKPWEPWFVVNFVACFTFCGSLIILFARCIDLFREVRGFHKSGSSFIDDGKAAIINAYDRKRYDALATAQMGLRVTFIAFVVMSAVSVIIRRNQPNSINGDSLTLLLEAMHVWLAFTYLCLACWMFPRQREELRVLGERAAVADIINDKLSNTEEAVGAILWKSAKIDLFVVSVVWMTTIVPGRPFHLAYILPMLGTWLLLGRNGAHAFTFVVVTLLLRGPLLAGILPQHTLEKIKPGGASAFLWDFFPNVGFWIALGMLFVILRHLRQLPRDQAFELLRMHKQETRLRKAFETLGTQQGHAVFAKDTQRKFIFANEVLLKKFAQLAERNKWKLDKQGRVLWKDIGGETDESIGMFAHAEYEKSDLQVLTSTKGADDHFEDYEPGFCEGDPQLWTRKEAIREDGVVVGLIGYVVDGLPVQMQRMSLYLTETLPVYALMKDNEGHIVWANERLLKRLSKRIDELLLHELTSEGKQGEYAARLEKPIQARLKMLRKRHGPTDRDLYGEEGRCFAHMDALITLEAKAYTGEPDKFFHVIEDLIAQQIDSERDFSTHPYPETGWMEFHRFPDAGGCWVEVRKMPWWEEKVDNGSRSYNVKGTLVFFTDSHKTYLRRSIVWRWLETYCWNAGKTNVDLLRGELRQLHASEDVVMLSEFRTSRIFRRMLMYVKAFADGDPGEFGFTPHRRSSTDFKAIIDVVVGMFNRQVPVEWCNRERIEFPERGDDLFVVLTPLLVNAVEATLRERGIELDQHPVRVTLRSDGADVIATITNSVRDISEHEIKRISHLEPLSIHGTPGGGVFLATQLVAHLGAIAKKNNATCKPSLCEFAKTDGAYPGLCVTVRLPFATFAETDPAVTAV